MDHTLGNRRKPRFTVKGLTITINGKTYQIFNISEHGVGFLIDSPEEFQVGDELKPITVNGCYPVRLAGVPRHISQYRPDESQLHFRRGWVCGTEFTTQHDLSGGRLFREYIAENIEREKREKEK